MRNYIRRNEISTYAPAKSTPEQVLIISLRKEGGRHDSISSQSSASAFRFRAGHTGVLSSIARAEFDPAGALG